MTTNHHTPKSTGFPANASEINAPLSELDSAIDSLWFVYSGVASEYLGGDGNFSVPSGTGSTNGHTVQRDGSSLAQRANLDFIGFKATDGGAATEVEYKSVNVEALSADKTLVDANDEIQVLDPNGADRIVTLPAGGAANHPFVFINSDPTTYTIEVQKADTTSLFTLSDSNAREVTPDKAGAWYPGGAAGTTDIAAEIHAATSKTTPVDADEIGLVDSAASNVLKKLTWANLKATLKTYFDTLYVALTGNQNVAGVKTFTSFPVTPSSAPTTDYQAANKKYVDDNAGGVTLDEIYAMNA
jgi:hypothetical protein